LTAESMSKAGVIRDKIQAYERAANQHLFGQLTGQDLDKDGEIDGRVPCGEPFGDERTSGRLPDRSQPQTPFTTPSPEGPAVEYPPATPYTESPG